MYNNKHQSANINFNTILETCKKDFRPFTKEVEIERETVDIIEAIKRSKENNLRPILTEIKYRSPGFNSQKSESSIAIAREMIKGGSTAISVLTEPRFFGGSLERLKELKETFPHTPLLRKDFLFHPTQVKESYYYGADSILLISSFFEQKKLEEMILLSRHYGMEPLVEVHSPLDIERSIAAGAGFIAINNRDKDTLKIDLTKTEEMTPLITNGVLVSASGIESRKDLDYVLRFAHAALIGTSIMNQEDIQGRVRELVGR